MRRQRVGIVGVAMVVACLGLAGGAGAGSLGVAAGYGEFVGGDSTRTNTSSNGAMAVGGNAKFANFTAAGSSLMSGDPKELSLVVGGDLAWSNGTLKHGSGVVGGKVDLANFGKGGGGKIGQGSVAIDFAKAMADLRAVSAAQYSAADPTVTPVWGGLTFGSEKETGLQVFNVSAADFNAANNYKVLGGAGSTVVINILGDVVDFNNAGVGLGGGLLASGVLWNFVDAKSLTIGGIGVSGTVLAANAAVAFGNGQIKGGLIAASLSGSGTLDIGGKGVSNLFLGELRSVPTPPAPGLDPVAVLVPEPSSLAMAGTAALGCLAVALRRRR
jgi:choice-of-anchor A domain-containing protein